MLALGTLGLFVYAMAEPRGFSVRMEGLNLVPEPLWWLLGAVVSFYFGARELHHQRRRSAVSTARTFLTGATAGPGETTVATVETGPAAPPRPRPSPAGRCARLAQRRHRPRLQRRRRGVAPQARLTPPPARPFRGPGAAVLRNRLAAAPAPGAGDAHAIGNCTPRPSGP